MPKNPPTPTTIKEHRDEWFWAPAWRRMHCRRQQFNCFFMGQCGTGKSYASLYAAWLIDRSERDVPRFNIDKIAFSAHDFAKMTNQKRHIGETIILDDAALAIYSKDAMTRAVKHISKIFISQRHLRRCILLSAPSRNMLEKNVLQTLMTCVNMRRIVASREVSYGRAYFTQLNPLNGKLYFRRFSYPLEKIVTGTHLSVNNYRLQTDLQFKMPPGDLVKAYEKAKQEATTEHYEEAQKETAKKEKKHKRTNAEVAEFIKANKEQFLNKDGKYNVGKIAMLSDVGDAKASLLARYLNSE